MCSPTRPTLLKGHGRGQITRLDRIATRVADQSSSNLHSLRVIAGDRHADPPGCSFPLDQFNEETATARKLRPVQASNTYLADLLPQA